MSRPNERTRKAFLEEIARQLRGLDHLERREIIHEMNDHLQDTENRLIASGTAADSASTQAVAMMGDPIVIGQRLRQEHLSQRFSIPDTVMTILPLLLFGALAAFMPVLWELRKLWGPHSDPLTPLLLLAPALVICIWAQSRMRFNWLAILTGVVAILTLIPLTRLAQIDSQWPLSVGWIALFGLIVFPCAIAYVLHFGAVQSCLSLLGGVGVYGLYAWWGGYGDEITPLSLALLLAPALGVLVLGLASRRWLPLTSSTALITCWMVIAGYPVLQYGVPIGPLGKFGLGSTAESPMQVSAMISLPVLAASIVLLLAIHLLTLLQDTWPVRQRILRASVD